MNVLWFIIMKSQLPLEHANFLYPFILGKKDRKMSHMQRAIHGEMNTRLVYDRVDHY